jgi:hypothetical protein
VLQDFLRVAIALQGIDSYHLMGVAPSGHVNKAPRSSHNQKVQRGLDESSGRVSSNYYGSLLKWGHITNPLLCQPLALFHTILHSSSTQLPRSTSLSPSSLCYLSRFKSTSGILSVSDKLTFVWFPVLPRS